MIAAGAGLAVTLLWFLVLWSPQADELNEARDQAQQAEDEVERLELQLGRLEALQEQAPALRSQVEELRGAVPDTPNLAQFILDLDDIAIRSGVTLASISPAPPIEGEAPGDPATISVSLTTDGGYFQVLDFLNRLAAMDRVMVVDTLSLAAQTEGSTVRLAANISGRLFVVDVPLVEIAGQEALPAPEPEGGGPIDEAEQVAEDAEATSDSTAGNEGTGR